MKLASKSASWIWSKAAKSLNQNMGLTLTDPELWYNVGTLYEAGTDSTAIVFEVFVMASILHPAVVDNAHHELDSIVGMRMPTFDDLANVPYARAIFRELLHTDPTIFENPDDFDPERWIRNPDLPGSAFGFGRQSCPGLYVGQNSVLIAITRLLWEYDIGHAYENGQRFEVDPWNLTQGIGVRPSPFKASFCIRGAKRQEIIERAWSEVEKGACGSLQWQEKLQS